MFDKLKNLFMKNKNDVVTVEQPNEHIDYLFRALVEENLVIKVGEDLGGFSACLVDEIWDFRDEICEKTGFIFPPVKIVENDSLQENEYEIFVQGKIYKHSFSLFNQESFCKEILDSLKSLCKKDIDMIFSNHIAEQYIDTVQKNNSWMIWNLTNAMPIWGIRLVLVSLLKEGKSIKNINYIFEKMNRYATKNREINYKADPYLVCKNVCNDLK